MSKITNMNGLPKKHKLNSPMGSIISGINSALQHIAKAVTKLLTPLLGKIRPSHIKNSGGLTKKIQKTLI